MSKRIAASGVVWRGGALIVAVAMTALAGEKTPTLASSRLTYPNLDYKTRNFGALHEDRPCSAAECYKKANDTTTSGQVVGHLKLDYKILNLGTWHDDPYCSAAECYSEANDVNIWGQVVGESSGHSFCPDCFYGFRTDPSQPIASADLLTRLGGDLGSVALGLNDEGVAVGYSWPGDQAVRWVGTQPSSLDSIKPPWSRAYAINDIGMPVGGHSSGDSGWRAWFLHTGYTLLAFYGQAYDFNNHGVMVGYADVPNVPGVYHAFRWSNSDGFDDLGTLDSSCPTCSSEATAINDAGRIVGSSSFDPHAFTVEPVFHAFLWRRLLIIEASDLGASPFVDLGTLCRYTNHLCNSRARDINIHNHIVGQSETTTSSDAEPVGFIHQGTTMKDIHTLLSPVDRAQWRLTEARAINDLGQIVGTGYFQGDKQRAYLLTPPVKYIVNLVKALPVLYSPDLVEEQRSLGAIMDITEAAVERGDLGEASTQLDAYQRDVEALVAKRRLSRTHAIKLMAGAALIRREMEGTSAQAAQVP